MDRDDIVELLNAILLLEFMFLLFLLTEETLFILIKGTF